MLIRSTRGSFIVVHQNLKAEPSTVLAFARSRSTRKACKMDNHSNFKHVCVLLVLVIA